MLFAIILMKKNRTILVENIPPSKNFVVKLNNWFKRFGDIRAISCVGTSASIIFFHQKSALEAAKKGAVRAGKLILRVSMHPHPEQSPAQLTEFCNIERILLANSKSIEAQKNAEQETTITQDQIVKLKKKKTKVAQLKATLRVMVDQAETILTRIDNGYISAEEKETIKEPIEVLTGAIEDIQAELRKEIAK